MDFYPQKKAPTIARGLVAYHTAFILLFHRIFLILNQIPGLATHNGAQFSQGVRCYGSVMTDALQCLGVDALVGQPVKRNMMLFHILPHRPKRNWHPITPFLKNLRKVPEVFTVLDSLPEKVERQKSWGDPCSDLDTVRG